MAAVCGCDVPVCVDDKRNMLLSHYFALWDVVGSCDIQGSADSSIKNAVSNDIAAVIHASKIDRIFVNGRKAEALYIKFIEKGTGIKAVCLPSTSPANAAWSEERLVQIWKDKLTGRQ